MLSSPMEPKRHTGNMLRCGIFFGVAVLLAVLNIVLLAGGNDSGVTGAHEPMVAAFSSTAETSADSCVSTPTPTPVPTATPPTWDNPLDYQSYVYHPTGFWITGAPIAAEAYRHFTGTQPEQEKGQALVTYAQARAFCSWAGGDLPTEQEWAAAFSSGTISFREGSIPEYCKDHWHDTPEHTGEAAKWIPYVMTLFGRQGGYHECVLRDGAARWSMRDFCGTGGCTTMPFRCVVQTR